MRRRFLALVPLLALAAAPALAQNGTTVGALSLYPTFTNVGLRVAYTGDLDLDASAYLEWRPQGGGTWTRGMQLSRITNNRFAGSLLGVSPDTPYELRAVITDPDGGGSVAGTVRTRKRLPSVPTGNSWYVATSGSASRRGPGPR